MNRIVAVAVIAIGAVAGAWYGSRSPQPQVMVKAVSASTVQPAITVHVSGAVAKPGLVELATRARVADALAGAGGALPGADLTALNLASSVVDGQQIVVPARDEAVHSASEAGGMLQLNTASTSDLEKLPGLGPVLAARIVDFRDRNGPFEVIEDLLDVPGIGEAKLATLREGLVLP